jgi:ABC-type methionine transport system permease subunit
VMVGAVVVLIAIVHGIQAVGERLARRLDHRRPRFV